MTAYADLDTSVIDELPPGPYPCHYRCYSGYPSAMKSLIVCATPARTEGRQAYWVCTLIEESDLLEAQAAEATWGGTQAGRCRELNIGLVHGRMKPAEKQAVMAAFKQGELHLLVATTVIEVGGRCF
nr:ATP-dependent DNA helicase [Salmonella sp. NCTC 7297]